MPDIEISKIKARRGTDAQRLLVTLDQGELAYTLDTKRLFVGNGVTLGGVVVGSKIHPPLINYYSLSNLNAQVGDIVAVNNIFYQLTDLDYTDINNWDKFRMDVDTTIFSFDSNDQLNLNPDSLSAKYIDSDTVSNGLKISSGVLQVDFQPKSLELSSLKLSIKASGIDEREINSSTLIRGLTGGSGNKIGIDADTRYFYFDVNDTISLSGYNPFTLRFSDLNASWFGAGLSYNTTLSTLSATIASVDATSIIRNSDGSIKIKDGVVTGTTPLANVTVDSFGRVTTHQTSIVSALTGNATTNTGNSLSAIFNGSIVQTVPGLKLTTFTAISSSGTTLTLSSAGFLTFAGPTTTQEGQIIKRFAIPIFTY